jgi:hypothetical protein
MIETRIVLRAAIAGLVLQLLLALAGHLFAWTQTSVFLFGQMMCSATAGYLYGLQLGRGYAVGAAGGAVAGGLSAAPAIVLLVLAGDSAASMVAVGTGICMLTGCVGGAFGHMAAIMRKLGF